MLTTEQRDTLVAEIEAANLTNPEIVADYVLSCETIEDARAEFAKAVANEPTVSIDSSVGGSIWLACGGMRYMIDGGDGSVGIEVTTIDLDACNDCDVSPEDLRRRLSTATSRYLSHHVSGKSLEQAMEWLDDNTTHDRSDWYSVDDLESATC